MPGAKHVTYRSTNFMLFDIMSPMYELFTFKTFLFILVCIFDTDKDKRYIS